MIILDTNVLSALMRVRPEGIVVDWLNSRPREQLWVTSVTVFEIRVGLEIMPAGRRCEGMKATFERLLALSFEGRIAPFDEAAARAAATLAAERHLRGRPVGIEDTQIAGIAISRRADVCTRNIRHFEDAGIALVNPWA